MAFKYRIKRDHNILSNREDAPAWAGEVQRFLIDEFNPYFTFHVRDNLCNPDAPEAIVLETRMHGEVYEHEGVLIEKHSPIDFKEAARMRDATVEKYGGRFSVYIDTVDEYVCLTIEEKPGQV